VPGNGYDIVIGSGSDVARQAGKTGREEKTTRAKKSR
jgi:hypothetical protein